MKCAVYALKLGIEFSILNELKRNVNPSRRAAILLERNSLGRTRNDENVARNSSSLDLQRVESSEGSSDRTISVPAACAPKKGHVSDSTGVNIV